MNGLLHAQVLGDAAKGFDVLIFNETSQKIGKSNFFKQAVSVLHKKLIGSKVFNVKVTKSSPDGKMMNLYSHCSRKTNGAITLMGINFSNMRSKFNVKISSPMDSNAVILQYLLSATDGHVLLNNEKFSYEATPSYKFKKLSKQSISLILPPFSMAFWTIKNAKINECLNIEAEGNIIAPLTSSSSSDQLLKQLVANEFEGKRSNDIMKDSRIKRQLASPASYLPGLEWELPTFKFPSLMPSASNQKPIRDTLFKKNVVDVYKPAPVDVNPLQESDNPTLPKGDVYLLINDGKQPDSDKYEYVIDDEEEGRYQQKPSKKGRKKNNKIGYATESSDYFYNPYDYVDATVRTTTKKSSKKVTKQQEKQEKEIGELFEAENIPAFKTRGNDQQSYSSNIELSTIVKELPPTYRQSKAAMTAAKKQWDKQRILELLKDAEIGEADRAKIENAEVIEILDFPQNADEENYETTNSEEYEDDDDDFFTEDNLHRIRTRRNVDYAKNEIPKFGTHILDEDDDSIESLVDDVHLYLQPRHEHSQIVKENSHESTSQTPSVPEIPTTIRAINFFSKSLNDVLDVAHQAFVGWWNVFSPIEGSQY